MVDNVVQLATGDNQELWGKEALSRIPRTCLESILSPTASEFVPMRKSEELENCLRN